MDNLDAIRQVMATTVPRWQRLLDSLPAELLERVPRPGEWSAAQCLEHLAYTEKNIFDQRLRTLIQGGEELIAFDPDAPRPPEPPQTPAERLVTWAALRAEHLRLLAPLEAVDLDRTARHPEFGPTTLRMVLNTWAAHDLDHTVQAEAAVMQAFIPHTGHWRYRFKSTDVEAQAAQVS